MRESKGERERRRGGREERAVSRSDTKGALAEEEATSQKLGKPREGFPKALPEGREPIQFLGWPSNTR